MYLTLTPPAIIKTTHQITSSFLNRIVDVEIYKPDDFFGNEILNLLLVNDGQDLELMGMEDILAKLYHKNAIGPTVVVGIKAASERLLEYGVAGRPDFKNRGSMADFYAKFITKELLPFLHKNVAHRINGKKAFAGFSLGGVSAFDISWNNAVFDAVGIFSGSFWWRKKDLSDNYTDNDRICHAMIREAKTKPSIKFWLMTGTEDETADRNRNFIIDSIDDTIDIIKELLNKGYNREDIAYYERVGGKHDIETWGKSMPAFLTWAFGR